MSETLVKYTVRELINPIDKSRIVMDIPGVTIYLAADVDTLLRQREEELAEWKRGHDDAIRVGAEYQRQLATVTAERDGLDKDFTQVFASYTDAVTLLHDEQNVSNERRIQLAASQARCAELEVQLKEMYARTPLGMHEMIHEVELVNEASTERPPA